MQFSQLAGYWEKLEKTTSRNEMMEILAEVFKEAGVGEIDKVCYLSLGQLGPLYAKTEFNLAEKLMIKAVAQGYEREEKEVRKGYKSKGDLGLVAEQLARFAARRRRRLPTVLEVYKALLTVAREEGAGSQERKLQGMAKLLRGLDPVSARYVVRIPLGKMRLGFSDKTILDGLSFMRRADKSGKAELEQAYKVRPDVGQLAKLVKKKGIKGVSKLAKPEIGVPILMAKAQRMSSAEEILLKIGKCAVEPKIDGFRLQCHYIAKPEIPQRSPKGKKVGKLRGRSPFVYTNLFTRNLDEVGYMYPDIVAAVKKQVKAESVIFEGEAVAYNPQTHEYLPFQETVQRKRKYDIGKYMTDVPLRLIAFELLYLNGRSLLGKPYSERRKKLEEIVVKKKESTIIVAEEQEVDTEETLERLFDEAVSRGLEGVMAKRLDAPYQAGARNWNWIKYKRSYSGELADTIDCLVMGYDFGRGKRADFGIGGFLVGVYDEQSEVFRTVSKVGTGLSDSQWRKLRAQGSRLKAQGKPKEYDANKDVAPDVWVRPEMVVEIEADEITKSPVHTAGLALRFPRLKRFRDDKRPEQATTLTELKEMFEHQRRRKVR